MSRPKQKRRRNRSRIAGAFFFAALAALAIGCQGLLECSEREAACNEKALLIARNMLGVRATQIGFIHGYGDTAEYPVELNEALAELLELSGSDPNSLTNYELGRSLGLGVKITEGLILHYVPELKRYWR